VSRLRFLCVAGAFLVLSLSLAATGCSKKEAKEELASPAVLQDAKLAEEAPAQGKQPAGGEPDRGGKPPAKEALPRKIIYTATVRLIVEDFAKAEQELERLIEANQGYVIQSSLQGTPPAPRAGEWKAAVPVEKFKAFHAAAVRLGQLVSSNVDSQNVTEEFYNLKRHIENREAREAALRQMYKDWSQKALKPADILPIDQELDAVRKEIDRQEGRLQVLAKLSEMATVTVHLGERKGYVPPESPDFGDRVGRTFGGSLEALLSFGQSLVLIATALAPWLPLVAVVLVPLWLVSRRRPTGTAPPPVAEVGPTATASGGTKAGPPPDP
jgi:hypothetical protein